MDTKTFSKIWIVVIIIAIIFLGSGILLAKASVLKIPIFSDIFYQKRISDLGIQSSPEAVLNLEQKLFKGPAPLMQPASWVIHDIEVTDVELTSLINLICSEKREKSEKLPQGPSGPEKLPLAPESPSEEIPPEVSDVCSLFENFQIKFEKGRFIASAHIFQPTEADITIFGKILGAEENELSIPLDIGEMGIDMGIEKVYLGNLPLPKFAIERTIEEIELEIVKINRELNEKYIKSARIDNLEILEGKLVFKGEIDIDLYGMD